jgi:hypothetical protein
MGHNDNLEVEQSKLQHLVGTNISDAPMRRSRSRRTNIIQQMLQIPRFHWRISSEDVRDMWLDFPELQELFEDIIEERDPLGYDKAIIRGILWFNGKPPATRYGPHNFLCDHGGDDGLLLNMSLLEILKVAERYHAANFTTASGGGTSSPINERYISLGNLRRELQAEVAERTREWKTVINNEAMWGGISDIGARGEYGAYGYPFSV